MAGWHKGDAVSHILKSVDAEDSLAIYIGDDVTDEEAFEAVRAWADIDGYDEPWFIPDGEDEEEDVLQEITRPLIEYLQMKSAADELVERNLLGENTFIRNPDRGEFLTGSDDEFIKIGLFELIDAFQKILERIPDEHRVDMRADEISVKDKIAQIIDILEAKESITFLELFSDSPHKHEVIVTFLAILEMVKLTLIRIFQHVQTGVIRIFYL